jgi:hypothetical protein
MPIPHCINVYTSDSAGPQLIKIAEDATVEELIKAAGGDIGEPGEEIILLVETEEKLPKKEHKLCDHGIKHGHHVHFKIKVTVTNKNNGKEEQFKAYPRALVETIIERMYASTTLGIGKPSPEDRLRCKGGGDVFQYKQMHLGDYRKHHCHKLQWEFSGPTGGA